MEEVVSIIAPAYNHEKYIKQALESVACQTYQNKELIVIDDCSKDNTADLIQKYIGQDYVKKAFPAGIQFIRHEQNMNAHKTINQGINKASGKYIALINTDDYYQSNRIEVMLQKMQNEQGKFAFSSVKIVDENGSESEHEPFEIMRKRIRQYPRINLVLAIENEGISTGNYLFEKDLYHKVGGFDTQYHFIHDWDFILKVALETEPVFVEETSYIYRFHSTNTLKQIDESGEMTRKKDWEVQSVISNYLQRIKNQDYSNKKIPSAEVWDYFLNKKEVCFASSIWNNI